MFKLHPRLQNDTMMLGRLPLCRVLLMNDAHYPWLILVPERPHLREIHELDENDLPQLWRESAFLARQLQQGLEADKINIAALGNVVAQLHVHHIARYVNDVAWPAAVFGRDDAVPYTAAYLDALLPRLRELLCASLDPRLKMHWRPALKTRQPSAANRRGTPASPAGPDSPATPAG